MQDAIPQESSESSATTPGANPAPATAEGVPPEAAAAASLSLEQQLAAAEQKASELQEAWLRAKAEAENIRRRAQEDINKASKFAVEKFASELLAVKDSLEAALANENQSADALKSGVELTLRQLSAAFEKSNLNEINPKGERFDPHKHQAMSQIEAQDDATQPNTVLNVLQKGYSLYDRVIRPALVVVSKAKAAPIAPESSSG